MVQVGTWKSGAMFDDAIARTRRYLLWRDFEGAAAASKTVVFCGLNPSTANEDERDPTVTREMNFARAWGYGRYVKWNLFSLISPYPEDLHAELRSVRSFGISELAEVNFQALELALGEAHAVICAWGCDQAVRRLDLVVWDKLAQHPRIGAVSIQCLKITRDGYPSHPLYLSSQLTPIPYPRRVPYPDYGDVPRGTF